VSLYSFLLVCGCAFAQQQLQVENAAGLLTGDIAAGSLARLQLIYQGGPITPIDPATVSAQLLPMGFQDPLPLSVLKVLDATSVLALIPRDTPLRPASIRLSYNGQNSAAQNVNIVATSFGLYSVALGEAALAQNIKSNGLQLNNLTHPAHPQDFVTLWGTGLGPASGDKSRYCWAGILFRSLTLDRRPISPDSIKLIFRYRTIRRSHKAATSP
jgi:uncharacterized protein (TIGR03437 family)